MTTPKNIRDRFRNIFEPQLIEELIEHGQYMQLEEGEIILDIGQPIRVMPLILSGSVKIFRYDENEKEILLYYVNPNESCAMTFSCCMQELESKIKAVTEEKVEMIVIPVQYMDIWMSKYRTWKTFVMATIQDRFEELLNTVDQIAFQNLDQRLVNYLREKSKVTQSSLINLSHEQIAHELASSRVVISRLLKKLENQGKLLLYRNQIKLLKDF